MRKIKKGHEVLSEKTRLFAKMSRTTLAGELFMKTLWKRKVAYLGAATLGATMLLSASTAMAADVTVTVNATVATTITNVAGDPLDFDTIDLIPGGDTITINASGPANGQDGTITSLNGSGVIQANITEAEIDIDSGAGTNFTITVVYPADGASTITDGTTTVPINAVEANSGDGAGGTITHTGGVQTVLHIGGELVFPAASTTGAYTGTMTITLNYT